MRGTQHGSSRRMPAPASMASWLAARFDSSFGGHNAILSEGRYAENSLPRPPRRDRRERPSSRKRARRWGHIAEIFEKSAAVNPLWVPPWRSIEPAEFGRSTPGEYGQGADNTLLAAIMGHNLCLDIFGGPSDEETAAGLTAHGEGSIVSYDVERLANGLLVRAAFPLAHLQFEREISLHDHAVLVSESVENLDWWICRWPGPSTSHSARRFSRQARRS